MDSMLDSVDNAVRRLEAERKVTSEIRSGTRILSGYVGTVPVTAGVSASGARTYSIPIMTTDAPGGAPVVSLEYNSQGRHGAAGYGWEIGGLSTITAANRTPYYNDTTVAASATNNPVWALDGMPLVQHTQEGMGSYTLRTARGNVFVSPGLLEFQALSPDGRRLTYGNGAVGVGAVVPIYRTEDRNGNLILYEYSLFGHGRELPTRIRYGGKTAASCTSSIVFSYVTRDDVPETYHAGSYTAADALLKRISCLEGTDTLARYDLRHTLRDDVWVLTRVDCSREGVPLQPVVFSYDDSSTTTQHSLQSSTSFFSAGYTGTDLVIGRGKILEGSFDDGLVFHARYNQYDATGGNNGSGYPTGLAIAVAPPPLIGNIVSLCTNVTTGNGFQLITPVDADGNGTDELVKVNFGAQSGQDVALTITRYRYNGTAVVQQSSGSVYVKGRVSYTNSKRSERRYYFGDFTGCGHVQMLTTTSSYGTSYAALIDLPTLTKVGEKAMPSGLAWNSPLLVLDINRDGRTEVCLPASGGLASYTVKDSGDLALDTTYGWGGGNPYADSSARNFIADVNGDGYPDILTAPSSVSDFAWNARLFTGTGFISRTVYVGTIDRDKDDALFMDVNRDGLADFVKAGSLMVTACINRNGTTFYPAQEYSAARPSGMSMVPLNTTETGSASHVMMLSGAKAVFFTDPALSYNLRTVAVSMDGFGNTTENTYGGLMSSPQPGQQEPWQYIVDASYVPDPAQGLARLSSPVRTLCAEETFMGDGTGAPVTGGTSLSHVYYVRKNAVMSTRGLGFLGFASSATWDVMGGIRTQTTFDPAKFGAPTFSKTYLNEDSGNPFRTDTLTWDSHSTTYGKLDPRLVRSVTADVLTGVTTSTDNNYDDYGFPVRVRTTRSVAATGSVVADSKGEDTYNSYSHSVSSSLFVLGTVAVSTTERTGRLYGTAATMNGEPATDLWSRKTEWTYDAKKQPSTKKEYAWLRTTYLNEDLSPWEISADYDTPGSGAKGEEGKDDGSVGPLRVPKIFHGGDLERETRWTYDARGNVTLEKVYLHGASDPLETSWTYDSSGRRVTSSTDPLGLTTAYSDFDVFGNPSTVTDHTGTTTFTYDTWGRLTRTDHPSKAWEDESRTWGGKGLYTVFSRTSLGARDSTHCDAAGRVVRSADRRYNGTWRVVRRQYDTKGRLWKESLPFKGTSTPKWNTWSYDDYGRDTLFHEYSGRDTRRSYNGRTTSVTSDGITTTTTVDADGNAVLTHDPGGDIVNALQPHGLPFRTTAPGGAVTTLRYDQWGNRSRIEAPSFGTQTDTTVWNADGTSVSTTVNRYGTTVSTRDIHGRTTGVARTAAPGGTGAFSTTYTYNSKGLLTSESSTNGTSRSYTYDSFDRPTAVTETADGLSFTATTVYSDTTSLGPVGSVRSVTFKRGNTTLAKEMYTYAYGHRKKVALYSATGITGGTTVWQLTGENALGEPTGATTLGITRTYAYTASGLPTSRTTGTVTEGYSINAQNGNLTSRTPPAPSGGTAPGTESFTYGALNRIASWTRPGTGSTTATAQYDGKGNITSLSTSGTMTYNGGSTDPYTMTGYTPASSSSARILPTVVYNPQGRPASVTTNDDYEIDFVYDAGGERKKMTVTDTKSKSSVVELTRTYLGGRFERDKNGSGTVTAERLWLGGDAYSAPVVLTRSGSSGSWTAHNVGRDLLGSITSVQTSSGTVEEHRSYDPWGRARNPQTLVPYSSGSEPTYMLGRGFTGHEWVPHAGLWNANARLYDPILGRFLSPDPFVQAPGFTQNYNRFAYALNCPLKYTDPSGMLFGIDDFAFALIVGAVSGALTGAAAASNAGARGFGEWSSYIMAGAIVGTMSAGLASDVGLAVAGATRLGGFIGGFTSGMVGGAAAGAFSGFFNTGFAGGNSTDLLNSSISSAISGAVMGGVFGGIGGGMRSRKNGGDFWTGIGESYDCFGISENKITLGEGMEYTNEYARKFSKYNFGDSITGVNDLHADGSLPNYRYYKKGDLVYKNDDGIASEVLGSTVRRTIRKYDVYLFKAAFISKEQLYLTMGHEYLHAGFYHVAGNSLGKYTKYYHHAAIYSWELNQARVWNYNVDYYSAKRDFFSAYLANNQFLNSKLLFPIISTRPF